MVIKSVNFFVKSTVTIVLYMGMKYWEIKGCRTLSTDGQINDRNMSLVTM